MTTNNTRDADREGLLPCPLPWCEADDRGDDYYPVVRLHHFGNYRVVCTSCVCEGPLKSTKEEAIAAWNARAPHSQNASNAIEQAARAIAKVRTGCAVPDGITPAPIDMWSAEAALLTERARLRPLLEGVRELMEEAPDFVSYDRSGSRAHDGLLHCSSCGQYENDDGIVDHKPGCFSARLDSLLAALNAELGEK